VGNKGKSWNSESVVRCHLNQYVRQNWKSKTFKIDIHLEWELIEIVADVEAGTAKMLTCSAREFYEMSRSTIVAIQEKIGWRVER